MDQYSILYADGDPVATQYFSGTLRANGFKSVSTISGLEALGLYKSGSPDLVIADLALAELDGLKLLEELKKYDPAARVIITTDNADKNMITRAFRMGVLDVLEKPFNPEFLIAKIRDLLAREDRALEGNLQMMSLSSIIQVNCEERNQAQLILNHLGEKGSIYFNDGEIIHAEVGDLIGDEAIYALLIWNEGTFKLKMGVEPESITINKNWSGLLLEGLRRIDESTADWSPDWEGDNPPAEDIQENQIPEKIAKTIIANRDVTSVVIYSKTGTLIVQENSNDPQADIALGGNLEKISESIGSYINGGDLVRIELTGSDKRIYFQQQDDDSLLLSLTKRSSTETIYESVQTIYQRYKSA